MTSKRLRQLVTACALVSAACGSSGSNGGDTSSSGSSGGGNGSSGTGSGSSSGTGSSSGASSSGSGGSSSSSGSGGSHIQTIFLIVMENSNWSTIMASSSATFITGLLTDPEAAYATQYYDNPNADHPSEPNYIWLEAATAFDNPPTAMNANPYGSDMDPGTTGNLSTSTHLATQLTAKGLKWREYAEGITGNDCPVTSISSTHYATKHVPFVFFSDIVGSPPTQTPTAGVNDACKLNIRPYTELAGDLTNNTVAQYNFITPNLCDDMHGDIGCPSPLDPIKPGNDWLAQQVPIIRASNAYKNGGAIFITWDESENGENPIGMIVLSPLAKSKYHNSIKYYHSSMVRTVEEVFGLSPFLNDAANQVSLSDLFATYP